MLAEGLSSVKGLGAEEPFGCLPAQPHQIRPPAANCRRDEALDPRAGLRKPTAQRCTASGTLAGLTTGLAEK